MPGLHQSTAFPNYRSGNVPRRGKQPACAAWPGTHAPERNCVTVYIHIFAPVACCVAADPGFAAAGRKQAARGLRMPESTPVSFFGDGTNR